MVFIRVKVVTIVIWALSSSILTEAWKSQPQQKPHYRGKYCQSVQQSLSNAVIANSGGSRATGQPTHISDAQEQIEIASRLQACYAGEVEDRAGDGINEKDEDVNASEQVIDDVQNLLEFFASMSLNPSALMAVTRRNSIFTEACQVGLKYMEAASRSLAVQRYKRPLTAEFKSAGSTSRRGGYFGIGSSLNLANADIAQVEWNSMAEVTSEGRDARTILPAAQRFLLGADQFPQSYTQARDLLISSIKNTGSSDALSLLSWIDTIITPAIESGRSFSTSGARQSPKIPPWLQMRLAFAVGKVLRPSNQATSILASKWMEFGSSLYGMTYPLEVIEETRHLLQGSSEMAPGMVALDLLYDLPIKMHSLLSMSSLIARGDSIATHILARVTSGSTFGMQTCSQAWSLYAQNVRRDLWIQESIDALLESGDQKTTIKEDRLLLLALAGVEQAEWAIGRRAQLPDELRRVALSFSAHRGRAAAQSKLAQQESKHEKIKQTHSPSRTPKSESALNTEEDILDQWNVSDGRKAHSSAKSAGLSPHEIRHAQRGLLIWSRGRWLGSSSMDADEVAKYASLAAEVHFDMAADLFLGRGVEQNLQEALNSIGKISHLSKHLISLEWALYIAFQLAFSFNYFLLKHCNTTTLFYVAIVSPHILFTSTQQHLHV